MGKTGSDLMEGVSINGDVISGTLKAVTGYTGFSSNVDEQEGNYLALKIATSLTGVTTTVELIGGTLGHPVTLDSDMNIVLKITDPATQKVKVVTTKDGESLTNIYKLTGLTLATE